MEIKQKLLIQFLIEKTDFIHKLNEYERNIFFNHVLPEVELENINTIDIEAIASYLKHVLESKGHIRIWGGQRVEIINPEENIIVNVYTGIKAIRETRNCIRIFSLFFNIKEDYKRLGNPSDTYIEEYTTYYL